MGNVEPILISSLLHTSAPPSTTKYDSKNHDDAVIVVDDSDSDAGRPPSTHSSRSKGAVPETHAQSRRIVNSDLRPSSAAPRESGVLPHLSSRNDRSSVTTLSSPFSSQRLAQRMTTTTADDDEIIVISPSEFPNKETRRNQFRRNAKNRERNKRMEHKQRQQQLLKVKIEAKEAEALASSMDTSSQEPIPPPQAPEVADPVEHLPVPTASQQVVNLAPQWFHDDPKDIWARAPRIRTPTPASRRKFQGRKLNEVRPQIFNFDIMQWVNRMGRI